MPEYAAGPYLALYTQYVQRVKTRGWTYSGQIVSKVFKYSAGEARVDSPATELTFEYCQDGRQNRITKDGKLLGKGILVAGKIYVRPVDGKMKLWDSTEREVSSCAEGF